MSTIETRAPAATGSPAVAAVPTIANPAALGLGGFALTTFVLSTHNAGWAPDMTWVGGR